MSADRRPGASARLARFAWTLVLAMSIAGCDLMVAPPPSARPSRAVSTPLPTPVATPTEVDEFETIPPEPTEDPEGLLAAADALSDLDSYRVVITTRGIVPATTPGGSVGMTSLLVQGDAPAARFVMTGADGFAGGRLEAVVIGDEAWLKEGSGAWTKSPGGAADFDAAFTTMSPSELAAGFDTLSPALRRIGSERRNGIASQHFRADSTDPIASDAGLVDGSVDLWRATSGGYLVALDLDGSWLADDGTARRTTLRIDVGHVDDRSNVVSPP